MWVWRVEDVVWARREGLVAELRSQVWQEEVSTLVPSANRLQVSVSTLLSRRGLFERAYRL